VNNTCTDADTIFDDDVMQEVKVLDKLAELGMMCSPCMASFAGLESVCDDENNATRCDEGSPCQTAMAVVQSECADVESIPGMEEEMSVDEMLGFLNMMCVGCLAEITEYGEDCEDTPMAVCEEGSHCNNLFTGLKEHCDPHGAVEDGPACMTDPSSCECMVEKMPNYCYESANGNSTMQSSVDCSEFCSGYTHAACEDDENSCHCLMVKDPNLCDDCEGTGCGGCEMDCMAKFFHALMHLSLMACFGQPKCIEAPAPEHPIWTSPIMAGREPRKCA